MEKTMRVAALLTCHNRREETLTSLGHLHRQELDGVLLDVFLVDAGSTDGTAQAVAREHPNVNIITGGEDLYWNAGMRLAMDTVRNRDPYDYYLWLNDDTRLDPNALGTLLHDEEEIHTHTGRAAIVVGAVRDPLSGSVTYGGVRRENGIRPLKFTLVPPSSIPLRVETMNGNIVLLPAIIVDAVGNLDRAYSHAMGDYDYGLRAGELGFSVWQSRGTVGTCRRNAAQERSRNMRDEWRRLQQVKGLPLREWIVFSRRWGGPFWIVYAVSPYIRRLSRVVTR